METRKDRMANPYVPKLHDYVKYHCNNMTHEGWVYYADHETISNELGVKDKPKCQYTKTNKHEKTHILLVCPVFEWHKLEYVKSRRGFHDGSIRNRTEHDE